MRHAVHAGALSAVMLVCGCVIPFDTKPPVFGPLEAPEGAMRSFYTRVLLRNGVGTGALLDESLFAFRLPGEQLDSTRAALGTALVEYLGPVFERSVVLVDSAVIRIEEAPTHPSGDGEGEEAVYDAPLVPLLPEGTRAVVRARLVDRSDDDRGHVMHTTWRLREHRWRLVQLSLDGAPVLPMPRADERVPAAR